MGIEIDCTLRLTRIRLPRIRSCLTPHELKEIDWDRLYFQALITASKEFTDNLTSDNLTTDRYSPNAT